LLGCSFLLGLPTRRRRAARVGLWLIAVLVLGSACGGHSNNGTPAGNYTVTVKATNGTATRSAQVAVTVQ
jgi:hypothetical protein